MTAVFTKIFSLFVSLVMAIVNLFGGAAAKPEDPYERLETPEYYLGTLVSTDAEDIVARYNAALIKTETDGEEPEGKQMLKLIAPIEGDGAIGTILKVAEPAIDRALAKNNYDANYIPGKGKVLVNDVTNAALYETEDGTIFITLIFNDQTDGPDSHPEVAGPVARGIGTLGSIDNALAELGAEFTQGRETVELKYTNAYVNCEIDPETGYIIRGTWHYDVDVSIGEARLIMGIAADLKNIKGKVEYAVVLGD